MYKVHIYNSGVFNAVHKCIIRSFKIIIDLSFTLIYYLRMSQSQCNEISSLPQGCTRVIS